jgi:hypothetical protein
MKEICVGLFFFSFLLLSHDTKIIKTAILWNIDIYIYIYLEHSIQLFFP